MQASQDLFDLLVSKDFTVKTLDNKGKPVVDPQDAEMFSFDFETANKNYGTVVVLINDNQAMECYYGDNVGKNMEGDDKDTWYDFLNHIKRFATRNMFQFNLKNMNRLRYTMQGMAAINEGLFEGWNGTKMTSYNNKRSNVRLKIVHDKPMEETDQRWRAVKTMFIETPEGERFKLPFKSTSAGKAMTRHVMEGGNPYDTFGNHIVDIVRETNALARFLRGKTNQITEAHQDYELVQELKERYKTLRSRMKKITGKRGYHAYKESWDPAQIEEGIVGKLAKRLGKAALKHGGKIAVPAAIGTMIAMNEPQDTDKKEPAPTADVVKKQEVKEAEYDFNDGDLVVLVPPYAEDQDEVYTLSQWDGKRGWIGDEDNRGWYVEGHMIAHAPDGDDDDDDMDESQVNEGNVKKRFYQIRDMLAKLDERMTEEGLYGNPNTHTVAGKITSGDIDGAMEELWYAYAGEEGDSGEYTKGPLIDDFKKEVEELMRVEESNLAQQINFGNMNDKESWWDKAKAVFTPEPEEPKKPTGDYKLKTKDDDMKTNEGFRNELQGGKVPVGNYTFTYEMDNPADLGFVVRSAEERGMAVLAQGKRKARIDGNAGQHTSLVRSLQDLSIRTRDYNGSVTEPHRAGDLQMESVPEGKYMIWTVTHADGSTDQFKGDDEEGARLKKKYPNCKVTTDWVVRSDEELYDDAKANNMKELNEFENWADDVTEGTWAIPDTKDKVKALQDFMSQKQPVGIDGADAQDALYDIIGDDDLMDDLYELSQDGADVDARVVVMHWLEKNMPELKEKVLGGDLEEAWRPDARFKAGMEVPSDAGPDSGTADHSGIHSADDWPKDAEGMAVASDPDQGSATQSYSPPTKDGVSPPTRRMGEAKKPDYIDLDDDGDTEESMKKAAKDKAMKEEHDLDTSEPVKKPQRDPMLEAEANDWARLAGLAGKVYEPIAEETVEEAFNDMDNPAEAAMLKGLEDFLAKKDALSDIIRDPEADEDTLHKAMTRWAEVFNDAFKQGLIDRNGNPKQEESMQQRLEREVMEDWGSSDWTAAISYYQKNLAKGMDTLDAANDVVEFFYDEEEGESPFSALELLQVAAARGQLELQVEEGNAFSGALANAKRDGKSEFEVDGKTYKVDEAEAGKFGQDTRSTGTPEDTEIVQGETTMEKPVEEAEMTGAEKKERERLVKGMKKGDWSRYGDRGEEVMYATATKRAMEGMADVMGDEEVEDTFPELPQVAHSGDADDYADKYSDDGSRVGTQGKDTADDDLSWIKRALGNK